MDDLVDRLKAAWAMLNDDGDEYGLCDTLSEAAAALEAARVERDALREALKGLIAWFPSAGTYQRLGFDPEAPMLAYEKARAALKQEKGQ